MALLILLIGRSKFTSAQNISSHTTAVEANPNKTSRYIGTIELGYLYGKTSGLSFNNIYINHSTPTVQFFNGYRLNPRLALGATIAFDFYQEVLITPIALGIKGAVLDKRVSPYYSLDVGYGATILNSTSNGRKQEGGFMFNPTLGFRVNTGNMSAFTFGVGFKSQRAQIEYNNWGTRTNQNILFKRLSLRTGFMF